MNKEKSLSHDTQLFSRMVDILFTSGTGKHDYGTEIKDRGVLASVMNGQGYRNRHGGKLNANTIYQIIHRMKDSDQLKDHEPDWSELSSHRYEHEKYSRVINSMDFTGVKHWFDEN